MQAIAPDVYVLWSFPRYAINSYLIGDIVVDAGTRYHRWLLLPQLRRRRLTAHVLTHAHPDHQGASHAICTKRGLPLWCGAVDAAAVARGSTVDLLPDRPSNRLLDRWMSGPAQPVARVLREGDVVGGFEVIETPGHTPGHIGLWRASDRVLLIGDVLANNHPLTQWPGLRQPAQRFTRDPALNRQSARKLAALRPRLICFGHGPPLRDGDAFVAFIEQLPE